MKIVFAFLILFLSLPTAVFSADWKNYPYYPDHAELEFPKDEGSHKGKLLEWWYIVMHVKGETTGDDYSILVTHFSNKFRFFDVTNITKNIHTSGTTRGRIHAKSGHLEVEQETPFGTDFLHTKRDENGDLIPFEYEMETHHDTMGLMAELQSQKPPMMVGGDAYVQIGKSGWSWYYSLSRLAVRGTISQNGVTENFTGIGWMDHQWGPFLISPVELGGVFETYEWFSVQLDNGTEMMISNIYNRRYQLPQKTAYGGVGIYYADGSMDGVVKKTFIRTRYWQDPVSQSYMSMGWRLIIPEMDIDLVFTPKIENQMVQFPLGGSFWEGATYVSGTMHGQEVKGVGFGELMHHFQVPELEVGKLKSAYKPMEMVKAKWKVKNPDEGNPLTFDVDLLAGDRVFSLVKGHRTPWYRFRMKDVLTDADVRFLETQKKLNLRITAQSVDGVIASNELSKDFRLK